MTRMTARCPDCGLPDPYHGEGDGIGSCMCWHCTRCGQVDEWCTCPSEDWYDE